MSNSFRPSQPPHRGSSSPKTTVLRTEPGIYGYNQWKNISIGVWVGQATLPAVRGIAEMSAGSRHFRDGRSSVVFVLNQLPAPTPEAQAAFARVYESDGLAIIAIILEGEGFWASGIRSMTSNVQRAAASSVLVRVCTTVDEVALWFPEEHRRRTGVHVDAADLAAVLRSVREEAAERALAARANK